MLIDISGELPCRRYKRVFGMRSETRRHDSIQSCRNHRDCGRSQPTKRSAPTCEASASMLMAIATKQNTETKAKYRG